MKCDFQFRRQFALWISGLTVAGAGWATQIDTWGQTIPSALVPAPAQVTPPATNPTLHEVVPVPVAAPAVAPPSATLPAPGSTTAPSGIPLQPTPTTAPPGIPVLPTPATAPMLYRSPVQFQTPAGAIPGAVELPGSNFGPGHPLFAQQAESQQWDQAALALVQKYGQTKDEKARVALNQQLTDLVSKQFDRRQQFREKQLKELEEKVAQLRSLQDRRTAAKGEIVQDRVNQLLRQADGLGWGAPEEGGGPTPYEVRYGLGTRSWEVFPRGPMTGTPSPIDPQNWDAQVDVDPTTGAPSSDLPPAATVNPTVDQ